MAYMYKGRKSRKQLLLENEALRLANADQADKLLQAQARVRELEREISVLRER